MNKLKVIALVLLIPALALACGEEETPDATDEEADGERLLIEVEAQDFRFIPASFRVEPGTTVEVIFENTGEVAHTFTVPDLDIDIETDPGGSTTTTFTAPEEEAVFPWHCRFHAPDMRGDIFVGDAAPASDDASEANTGYGDSTD